MSRAAKSAKVSLAIPVEIMPQLERMRIDLGLTNHAPVVLKLIYERLAEDPTGGATRAAYVSAYNTVKNVVFNQVRSKLATLVPDAQRSLDSGAVIMEEIDD